MSGKFQSKNCTLLSPDQANLFFIVLNFWVFSIYPTCFFLVLYIFCQLNNF